MMLAGTPLHLPEDAADHAFHLYVVRTAERARVQAALDAAGIGTAIHYPTPPHRQPAYRELAGIQLPIADRLAGEVLSLPLHPALSDADVHRVAEVLRDIA
jgi:dTDP-4-amino-4,6-dideoxygalactose transaminase